jgi:hypothetical protein
VIFIGGPKGGVGKSTCTSVAVNHALSTGVTPFLVEGDQSIPDVAKRYRGYLDGIQVALQRPDTAGEAVTELLVAVEDVLRSTDKVITNLPGGYAGTTDTMVDDLIGPTLKALGVEMTTVYVIGPGEESVTSIQESRDHGLISISNRVIAVPNAFFGNPERFAWHRSSLRMQWLEEGLEEFTLPMLIPRIAEHIRDIPGPYSLLASGEEGDLSVVERAGLSAWLRKCAPLGDWLLNNDEMEDAA